MNTIARILSSFSLQNCRPVIWKDIDGKELPATEVLYANARIIIAYDLESRLAIAPTNYKYDIEIWRTWVGPEEDELLLGMNLGMAFDRAVSMYYTNERIKGRLKDD